MNKCQVRGERLSSFSGQTSAITLEGLVLVVATKQEGKMLEKKSSEDEKKRIQVPVGVYFFL